MSEPMSTHEIEDVLSSIRRLVSEDLRPAPKPEAPAAAAGAKLLLTPALRVADDPSRAPAPTFPPKQAGPQPEDAHSEFQAESLPESQPKAHTDGASDAMAEPAPEPAPAAAEPQAPTAEGDLQDVVARLGAAVGEGDEQWESPFGDPPAWDEVTLTPPAAEAKAPAGHGRLHFDPTEEDLEDPAAAFLDGSPEELAQDGRLSVELPDFGAADHIEDGADAWADEVTEEPVAPRRRVVSPPADDWADAAEAEVRAKLDREIEAEAQSMFAAVETTFDEEVLRDLVRDIIREELAGSLGERITRNVRKLVRTEIARALAVREFE